MEGHAQYVHCLVHLRGVNEPFYLTVAYGSNDVIARRELWSGLRKQKVLLGSDPWLVMGDFNAMLFPHDGFGGVIKAQSIYE